MEELSCTSVRKVVRKVGGFEEGITCGKGIGPGKINTKLEQRKGSHRCFQLHGFSRHRFACV